MLVRSGGLNCICDEIQKASKKNTQNEIDPKLFNANTSPVRTNPNEMVEPRSAIISKNPLFERCSFEMVSRISLKFGSSKNIKRQSSNEPKIIGPAPMNKFPAFW